MDGQLYPYCPGYRLAVTPRPAAEPDRGESEKGMAADECMSGQHTQRMYVSDRCYGNSLLCIYLLTKLKCPIT